MPVTFQDLGNTTLIVFVKKMNANVIQAEEFLVFWLRNIYALIRIVLVHQFFYFNSVNN